MSSIPLPALSIHAPEQQDPLSQYAKIAQLRGMQQQQQLGQQQLIGAQQENQQRAVALQDQQAMTKAMQDWDGKDMNALAPLALKHGASSTAVMGLRKQALGIQEQYSKIAEQDATTGTKNLETLKGTNDLILGRINGVLDSPDAELPQNLTAAAQELATQKGPNGQPLLDPQHAQMAAQIAQSGDPKQIRQALGTFAKGYMSQSQEMQKAKDDADLAAKNAQLPGQSAESQQKQAVLAGTNAQGLTADQQMTLRQGQQRIQGEAAGRAETARHNKASEGSLTPEALTMAADQYAESGVMPALGRTAGMRSQIMNEAARTHPTLDVATNAAAFKANQASLAGLQKNYDSVHAFESTANKNLDLFLEQAGKVVDSGSPWINRPLRTISKGMLGSADQVAYETARQVAVNEIAKVTSSPGLSGQLTDSARNEISSFNPNDATLQQTYRVAKVLRQEMQNRDDSYQEQIADIRKRIGGASPAPAAGNVINYKIVNGQLVKQ